MKKLKICLCMQGNREWFGGIEYTKNMILALNSLASEDQSSFELSLLSIETIDRTLYEKILPYVKDLFFMSSLPTPSFFNRAYRRIDRFVSGNNDYEYHTFFKDQRFDFVYPFSFNSKRSTPYRFASWIPDFQHKHLPHFFSEEEIRKRDELFQMIATYAPMVILSSKTAQADFRIYFPRFAEKSRVLSFATSPDPSWYIPDPFKIQEKYALPDKFFMICNQFWMHKNHTTVFHALHELEKKSIRPALVCTGSTQDPRDTSYMEYLQKMIDEFGIRDRLYILGMIPRFDQIQLLRCSIAVIQPSLFEGWSTVVEDARCLGKHMLASDISVHKEQNPPYCVFFQPESYEELAGHMEESWVKLVPGPDPEREYKARQAAMEAVKAYGDRILDIARGTS